MEYLPDLKIPHVVILGAGASLASFPNGDKFGRKLPLMNNFFDTLELDLNLNSYLGDHYSKNLEDIYDQVSKDPELHELKEQIEHVIWEYFKRYQICDEPTIYDYLLLCLRPKDLIATFNWDPLLIQAYQRNMSRYALPQIVFLHGSIGIHYCKNHPSKISFNSGICKECGSRSFIPDLLYPIQNKNYNETPFLANQWNILKEHLKVAPMLTIFGYSAPITDVNALELMTNAWGNPTQRNIEEIELIDIKSIEVLKESWKDFIFSHHFQNWTDFFDSWISRFPRRTIEAHIAEKMKGEFLEYRAIPKFNELSLLWDYIHPIQEKEDHINGI